MLAARSLVFDEMFRINPSQKVIAVSEFSFFAYKCLIEYLYCDDIRIVERIKDCSELVEILKLAKLHKMQLM